MFLLTAFERRSGAGARASRLRRWALRALVVCGWLLSFGKAAVAAPRGAAEWAAKPAWVQEIAPDYTTPVDQEATRNGRYTLLGDTRIRLGPGKVERYSRHVDMAVTQAGVAALGELEIEFSPQYQQLRLHRAALLRAGRVIDQTKLASLRMIEQEPDSADRVYSGTITALLVLSDVRPGDVVDVSYSIIGSNPILGGRFAGHVRLGASSKARQIHVQVESAAGRPTLHWAVRGSAKAPRDSVIDGQRVLTWELTDVAPRPNEDRIPADYAAPAELELSEFADWGEVAAWADQLYPKAPHPTLTAKANELRAAAPDLATAVVRAIRFVQDDVRYLSISLGPHSVKPHDPKMIFGQRFGDCKDKSYLLVELLRALGVEAHVALADSDLRGHLRESLPSPFAFDHVIAVIELNGKRHYVDATWSFQGGTLDQIAPPDLGAVLVIAAGNRELSEVPMPTATGPTISAETEFEVSESGSASLNVITTYRGDDADDLRARLASKSQTDLSHEYLNFYEKAFPGVALKDPLQIRDLRDEDVISVGESYLIPEFWRNAERHLLPDIIWDYLLAPDSRRREAPLYLANRVWIREVQRVQLPFEPRPDPSDRVFDDPAARVTRTVSYDGRTVSASHEYRSFADVVPLSALPAHLQFLTRARSEVGLDLEKQAESSPATVRARRVSTEASGWPLTPLVTLLVVGAMVVVGVVALGVLAKRRSRKRNFKKRQQGLRGELPQNPERAPSLTAALSLFTRSACACGAGLSGAAVEITELSFQERTLHAARAECAACGALRRAYFELEEAE
ncbi:MAG TPA: DUF3857 domain-containing protein [Polyangiaceae bacterium]